MYIIILVLYCIISQFWFPKAVLGGISFPDIYQRYHVAVQSLLTGNTAAVVYLIYSLLILLPTDLIVI